MTTSEIIFAVMVAMQGLLFLIGMGFVIAYAVKRRKEKSDKLILTAYILWAISPLFSMVGVFFGVFL